MNKLIPTQRLFGKTLFYTVSACITLIAILFLVLPAAQAQQKPSPIAQGLPSVQQNNPEESGTQLRIDVNPLLGLNVLAPSHAASYYDNLVRVKGDIAVNVGSPCPKGYTAEIATVGLVWMGDSGPVDIQFVPTAERGHSIGLLMWDLGAQRWRCTDSLSEMNMLHFANMSQGLYFMWVVTQDQEQVEGDMSITSPPPGASS